MNNINFIDEEYFLTRFPNQNEEYFNSLQKEQKGFYLKMYSLYSYFLIQYLTKKMKLDECDNILLNEEIKLPVVKEENMDMYQYLSSIFLKYFYIRNNIYIERLSKEDYNYLYNIYDKKEFEFDEEKEKFIERTFLNVILEEPKVTNHIINYGPDSDGFYKPSNAIIIGVRFDDYINSDEEDWPKKHFSHLESIDNLIHMIEYNSNHKLNFPVPICVIKYNDFSIKKKPIMDTSKKR